LTLRICHVDFIVLYQCKLLSLQHYILWLCILSMICISRTCFISCWDYIHITYIHENNKGIRNFNHLSQKANLKHIILSEPLLSLLIFSLLYPCISLNFLYVFLFPWPRISRAYTCDISWNYDWKLCEKKEKWCLMKRWVLKLPKVKYKKKKKKKCSFVFFKILCWKSLKSKEVKHWWLKMENLCALMKYLVWNIIFQNALLSLVWTFSFILFYLTLTLALLQPENKTFWFMHCL